MNIQGQFQSNDCTLAAHFLWIRISNSGNTSEVCIIAHSDRVIDSDVFKVTLFIVGKDKISWLSLGICRYSKMELTENNTLKEIMHVCLDIIAYLRYKLG